MGAGRVSGASAFSMVFTTYEMIRIANGISTLASTMDLPVSRTSRASISSR
jgi:hypothetical protein